MAVIKVVPKQRDESLIVEKHLIKILNSLEPLLFLAKVAGIFFFTVNKSTHRLHSTDKPKTIFYSSVYLTVYGVLFWISISINKVFTPESFMDLFDWTTNIYCIMVFASFLGQVTWGLLFKYAIIGWWNSLAENDTLMEKYGLDIDYKHLRKIITSIYLVKLTTLFSKIILCAFAFEKLPLLNTITVIFCYVITAIYKVFFAVLILHVHERFSAINKTIENLEIVKMDAVAVITASSGLETTTSQLSKLCRFHFKLCHFARRLNSIAAVKLFFIFTASLAAMLFYSYFLYHKLRLLVLSEGHHARINLLLVLFGVVAVLDEVGDCFMLTRSSMLLCSSANETPKYLHEFRNKIRNLELEELIQNYSLQFLHQRLIFTALGFFRIDFKMVASIFGTVITYLVLFIQHDQTSSQKLAQSSYSFYTRNITNN